MVEKVDPGVFGGGVALAAVLAGVEAVVIILLAGGEVFVPTGVLPPEYHCFFLLVFKLNLYLSIEISISNIEVSVKYLPCLCCRSKFENFGLGQMTLNMYRYALIRT